MSSKNLKEIRYVKDKFLEITWQVSGNCNYRCSYCHPRNHSQPRRQLGPEEFHFFEELFEIYQAEGFSMFKIFLTGGEPTYWPQLIEFCEFAQSRLPRLRIGINTNLSAPFKWWQENAKHFDEIVASFHIEFAKPDEFLSKMEILQDSVSHVHTKLMMVEDRIPEVLAFAERIKERCHNYRLEYAPVLDTLHPDTAPWSYKNPENEALVKSREVEIHIGRRVYPHTPFEGLNAIYDDGTEKPLDAGEVIAKRQNFFKGWQCQIDHSLFISEHGRITAGSCGVIEELGNLYEGRFTKHTGGVICPRLHCHCGSDIAIPKRRDGLRLS